MSVKIVAGKYKGFTLDVPDSARPTLSHRRQSLFDMLESMAPGGNGFFAKKIVMDCFAGSGAFGFEAISRGAMYVYFVEDDTKAVSLIHSNAKKIKEEKSFSVICRNAKFIKRNKMDWAPVDLIFLDPPYGKAIISQTLKHMLQTGWISQETIVITEENAKSTEFLDEYITVASKIYGNTVFKIWHGKKYSFLKNL